MKYLRSFLEKLSKIQVYFYSKQSLASSNDHLREEVVRLIKVKHDLEAKLHSPKRIIERIFTEGVKWYDWNLLPAEQMRSAYRDAQHFLESEVIHNIKNYIIATGAQSAMMEEQPDTTKIRDFQMTINGIELLFETLGEIRNPDDPTFKQ